MLIEVAIEREMGRRKRVSKQNCWLKVPIVEKEQGRAF